MNKEKIVFIFVHVYNESDMKNHKKPLNRSITIGCVIFIITLCVLLSIANLTLYKNSVFEDYRNYISHILNYALAHIDAEDLKECIDSGEESETYKETLLYMDDLMEHFEDIHYLYAVLPLNTNDTGSVMSVLSAERYYDRYIDTEGNLYLGWISDDEYDSETAAQLFEIMDSSKIVYFEEETEWGTDYTGAVPIRDSNGNPVAVLAVDIDISFLNGMIRNYAAVNISIVAATGAVFIIIFLLWSRRNITKPIRELEKSAVGFAHSSHDQRNPDALRFEAPDIQVDNEIKALSDAVVKMTDDMRDYVADIISAEEKAENMHALAIKDALTGLRNKTGYKNELKRIKEMMDHGETKIGFAVVDLNYLKTINDTYGHEKGDFAITKLARMICRIFAHSPVFRIGGDEFVVILLEEDYDNYDQLTEFFYSKLDDMVKDDFLEPWEKVSASIGAAFYDEEIDDGIDSLFKRADQKMYEKKKEMKASRE